MEDRLTNIEIRLTVLENILARTAYTQKQVAQIAGVSEATVIRHRRSGLITPIPGTETKFDYNAIANYIRYYEANYKNNR